MTTKREQYAAKVNELHAMWEQAGPSGDVMRITALHGNVEQRLDQLRDMGREVDRMRREVEVQETMTMTPDNTIPSNTPTNSVYNDPAVRKLRERVTPGNYFLAASRAMPTSGAEAEFNAALGMSPEMFPLHLLGEHGIRNTAIDGDAGANQPTWVDRVFAESAAEYVGITFDMVSPGINAVPVTTGGATGAQVNRNTAATDAAYTITVSEMKPKRASVHTVYSMEDELRLNAALEQAIIRDLRNGIADHIDAAVFVGSGAGESVITGLQTHGSVSETTVTQGNKVKGDELLKVFLGYVDGLYAATMDDVRIVASVGSNVLWGGTVHAAAVENQTVAQFLRASGMDWVTRAGIDTNTANGDFGAFVGLQRGIEGAGVASVWNMGMLVRDPYSDASKGNVKLTLNAYWDFALPRAANFKRVKYIA